MKKERTNPEQIKKDRFFQFLQDDMNDKIKILSESVADLQEENRSNKDWICKLDKENSDLGVKIISIQIIFDKQLVRIRSLMWLFIIIILILSATNLFLFRN